MVWGTKQYLFIYETEPAAQDPEIFREILQRKKASPKWKKEYLTTEKLELTKEENFEIILISIFRQNKSCFFQKQKQASNLGKESKEKKKFQKSKHVTEKKK